MARSKKRLIWRIIKLLVLWAIAAALAIVDYRMLMNYIEKRKTEDLRSTVIHEATIECETPITLDLFFSEVNEYTTFITDVSKIDLTTPASYEITVGVRKSSEKVKINIVDTTPPTGEVVPQATYTNWLPDVNDCVTNLYDLHGVNVEYVEEEPAISWGGLTYVQVRLTDAYGNETILDVPFDLTADRLPPLIYGPKDLEFYIGDPITYRDGVYVVDEIDDNPSLEIDTSEVNPNEEGTYPVYYRAKDEYGNETTTTIHVTFVAKPEGFVPEEEVYAEAQEVLDTIITDDMSDEEKAFHIFYWARYNIHYVGTSIKTHWTAGAHEGFSTLRGDCYTYWACCKVLLDLCDIPNELVVRNPAYNSSHYWNLVCFDGLWYHCDATPSSSHDGFYFMRTDSELDGSHRFNPEEDPIPDRAEVSVQQYLNFYTLTYNPPVEEDGN